MGLDEIGQATMSELDSVAYLLGNNNQKLRAGIDGELKKNKAWRLTFASTGEMRLCDVKKTNGKVSQVGEEVRLIDLPSDAGKYLGIFESIEGKCPADFATKIITSIEKNHGVVGRKWIDSLVKDPSLFQKIVQLKEHFYSFFVEKDFPTGAHKRVASHFCLLAATGEVASEIGITGWLSSVAESSAMKCYFDWKREFGSVQKESEKIITNISEFLHRFGNSKFQKIGHGSHEMVVDRMGFRREVDKGEDQYLILDEQLKVMARIGTIKLIKQTLNDAGMLVAEDGRTTQKVRLPGIKTPLRMNVVRLLGDESGDGE